MNARFTTLDGCTQVQPVMRHHSPRIYKLPIYRPIYTIPPTEAPPEMSDFDCREYELVGYCMSDDGTDEMLDYREIYDEGKRIDYREKYLFLKRYLDWQLR